ncbi:hypothetical protein [Undibacterium sp. SXout20W]|uniref:hypothetical protein n=1 Tax=Undibacterium sp. SXout20W TaxID=3413051 RepID=UPI003BF0F6BF
MEQLSTFDHGVPEAWLVWTQKLFKYMEACYGNRFLDMWINSDLDAVMHVWAVKLMQMTADELRRGRASLDSRDWPPTLPEFIKMCRPGLDPQVAYYEALEQGRAREEGRENIWSSPAIYWAWRSVGAFEFRNQSYQTLRVRWEKALADELGKGNWEPIPLTALQVGFDKKSTVMSKRGAVELNKMVSKLTTTKGSDFDHLGWARKIVARAQAGDKSIPMIAVKNACESLRVQSI